MFLIVLSVVVFSAGTAFCEDPVARLKEDTLAYFRPLKGKVTGVEGNLVSADLSTKSGIKPGMRLTVLREGAPFLHPVTKEPLGKTEAAVGTVQVKDVREDGALLSVVKGDVRKGDLLRISEIKVKALFFQDKSVDWSLAEHYYRLLKESGRIEFVDTPLDSGDDEAVLEEARNRGCAVALVLRGTEAGGIMVVRQSLFWVEGPAKIAEEEVKVESSYVKELNLGEAMYSPTASAGDALLFFDLPFSGRLVASGDLYGDGHMELIITSGRDIRVFAPGPSLQNLYEIKGGSSDNFLWIDTLDIDGDGKDEIIVTSMRGGDIVSSKTGDSMSGDPPSRTGSIVSSIYALRG
ncbi:MAG TPA: VCBS repeat-containing protein, partial [Thermodesulfovibrionales bacterium]|nr:VCBS repeat-containing protein [Thermodesulfovibrionales bacterium]